MTLDTTELRRLHGAATRKPLILGGNAYADKVDIDHHHRLIAAVKDRLFDAAPALLDAADRLARIEAVMGSEEAVERVARKMAGEEVWTGANSLYPAMRDNWRERATAALAALRELIGGV